jgi:hypothetical protein
MQLGLQFGYVTLLFHNLGITQFGKYKKKVGVRKKEKEEDSLPLLLITSSDEFFKK